MTFPTFALAAPSDVVDRVVAVVDGEPVTASDVLSDVTQRGEATAALRQPNSKEFGQAVRQFVGHVMLEREAKALGLNVGDNEISAYIEEIKRQNNVNEEGFLAMLQARNLTVQDYKKQISFDILRSRIVSQRIRSKVTISDQDIERYLVEHPEHAPIRGAVHFEQIFVPIGEDPEAARLTASTMHERAQGGESFSDIGADAYVDLGFVNIADLKDELQSAASSLEDGAVSDLIETPRGYYLLRLVDRQDTSELPEALKESLRNQLFQEKFKGEIDDYLNVALPKKYNVEIK